MKEKLYLAAMFSRRIDMEANANRLTMLGYRIVSRWVFGDADDLGREEIALLDLEDVRLADAVMSFTQPHGSFNPGGGRHVEFGYGLALGKRMILIGERENVFHDHPRVEQFDTLEDFIDHV